MASFRSLGGERNEDIILRRIESLERKVDELQGKNKKLEEIIKNSFISFKLKEFPTQDNTTQTVNINSMERGVKYSMEQMRRLLSR